ncbi:MAG: hypothetical protein WC838_03070, partial [Candidatus Margulisiibacteriota bacterium]
MKAGNIKVKKSAPYRIIGALYILKQEELKKVFGRKVASEDFFLAFLKYGNYEEFHYWHLTAQHQDCVDYIASLNLSAELRSKIKCFAIEQVTEIMPKYQYYAFLSGDPNCEWLAYFRAFYAQNKFPIVGIFHTISDASSKLLFHKLSRQLQPYDSMVCTSSDQRSVIANILS